jgi:hypothetical protein
MRRTIATPESRTAKRLRLILVMTAALWAAPARAGMEHPEFTADVKAYSCRELLALDEARENLALAYLSGYADGQRQVVRFDRKLKAEAIIRVLEHCRTSPESSVLEAFLNVTP